MKIFYNTVFSHTFATDRQRHTLIRNANKTGESPTSYFHRQSVRKSDPDFEKSALNCNSTWPQWLLTENYFKIFAGEPMSK